jgi:glycogen operon protein
MPDNPRYYINDTGTGNTVNLSHPRVIQMVTDSLRYWVTETHVDGFRFDLGTILAREPNGFDNQSGFLKACSQDPVLGTVKLVAEPWDCGPGGYQVGGFPAGWAEWNDKFRDTTRDYWRGEGHAAEIASRMAASADLFDHHGRRPWACVNFITAHDGFTLNDWASYNEKHNEANNENNQDGSSDNRSWNCGVEGPTEDPEINALRGRQIRNMLATLLMSQGTPMLLAGDEFRRSQGGNNNAYCQDSPISWVDWNITEEGQALYEFVQKLTKLRREFPILRRNRFLTGALDAEDIRDVTWINASGAMMLDEEWTDSNMRCFGMLIDGRTQATGIKQRGSDTSVLLVFNAHHDLVKFTLPDCAKCIGWRLLFDTNIPADDGGEDFATGENYDVTGRSVVAFQLAAE